LALAVTGWLALASGCGAYRGKGEGAGEGEGLGHISKRSLAPPAGLAGACTRALALALDMAPALARATERERRGREPQNRVGGNMEPTGGSFAMRPLLQHGAI